MVRIAPLALVNSLFSQELARHNAASAAGRLIVAREERLAVDAYLASHTRSERHPRRSPAGESGSERAAGLGARGAG